MTNFRRQHSDASYFLRVLLGLCTLANIFAFQAQTTALSRVATTATATQLKVAVDPSVVTKKELDDIMGTDFDADITAKRFQDNNYLYPKHVEVIEDIAPIAEAMVDEIVSSEVSCMKRTSLVVIYIYIYMDESLDLIG